MPSTGASEQRERARTDARTDAKKALVSLGIRSKDAERAVAEAVAALPADKSPLLTDLVKLALRLMPTRGEVAAPAAGTIECAVAVRPPSAAVRQSS